MFDGVILPSLFSTSQVRPTVYPRVVFNQSLLLLAVDSFPLVALGATKIYSVYYLAIILAGQRSKATPASLSSTKVQQGW